MTNLDKWRAICDGFVSPDSYIDMGFYYLIGACLQRRVWTGPAHMRLFPNQYDILVGPPGVGKGLVIKCVEEFLRFHKLPNPAKIVEDALKGKIDFNAVEKEQISIMAQLNYKAAQESEDDFKSKDYYEEPLLIPVGANATTYQALIKAIGKSIRKKNYFEFDKDAGKNVLMTYTHSSLCICLEEIASMFREKTYDLVNFLLQAYDCGDVYTYDTKTKGKDRVRKLCLNFFGGTTPAFMQSTFDDKLLTEGYASRTIYVYESRNRKDTLKIPDLTDEQLQFKVDILRHIKRLTELYGRVTLTKEAEDFREDWWIQSQSKRPNTSPKLDAYYARKNIHSMKLAMAVHFSDSLEMTMGIEPVKIALEFLGKIEKRMHYALAFDRKNPLYGPSRDILNYLCKNGPKTKREILQEFWGSLPNPAEQSLSEILQYLETLGDIKSEQKLHPKTQIIAMFYEAIKFQGNGI